MKISAPGSDSFTSLDEANKYLLEKCREANSMPLADGRVPDHLFEDEKKNLMPEIPPMACFVVFVM